MMHDDLLRDLAAAGLPGIAIRPTSVDKAQARELVNGARHHRLVGFVADAAAVGTLACDEAARSAIEEQARATAAHLVTCEMLLLDIHRRFGQFGIEYRVLKGSSTAHRFYPEPSVRDFADLDVLVRGADLDAAIAALQSIAVYRVTPELRRGFDRRFAKSVTCRSAGGIEVDLHRTLALGAHSVLINDDRLWARRETYLLAGHHLSTLPAEETWIHACVHAVLGRNARLVHWRDIAQIPLADRFDWDMARALVAEWELAAVVRHAVREVAAHLGVPPSGHLAPAWQLDASSAEISRLARERDRPDVSRDLGALEELARPVDRVRYAGSMAFPTRENLQARGLARRTHLTQLRGRVRHLEGRR